MQGHAARALLTTAREGMSDVLCARALASDQRPLLWQSVAWIPYTLAVFKKLHVPVQIFEKSW